MKNIFLLDTNVFLYDPRVIYAFPENEIGLQFSILCELDSFKKESSSCGYNARETIRILSDFALKKNLLDGFSLENGGDVKIYMPIDKRIIGLSMQSADDELIVLALELKNQGKKVMIVSKDFNLRVKASCFNVEAIDYQNDVISKDTFYHGWKEFYYPSGDIKNNCNEVIKDIVKDNEFSKNEFLLLRSSHKDNFYKLFRCIEGEIFEEVIYDKFRFWGIGCRNPHQEMCMNLLMDDSVQLIILCGPSGTGKTFLVLVSMLYKILFEEKYQRMLVSRPLVPLGADIGFLPGDLFEKLQTWMQPIRDNLDYLLYHINKTNSEVAYDDRLYSRNNYDGKKNKKYKQNNNIQNRNYLNADDIIGVNGKIVLEAITYMRGRSIPKQVIFIDEVQNLTPHEVKTLISRAGEGSKVILAGDPYQIDSPYLDFATNGLVVASEKFRGQAVCGTVYLQISERSLLSSLANELM